MISSVTLSLIDRKKTLKYHETLHPDQQSEAFPDTLASNYTPRPLLLRVHDNSGSQNPKPNTGERVIKPNEPQKSNLLLQAKLTSLSQELECYLHS